MTVTKGTRILPESPLFRVPRGGDSKEQLRDSISKKVDALREEQRQAFLSLRNSLGDEDAPELGRVRTNALQVIVIGSSSRHIMQLVSIWRHHNEL
jgi:hypothetical protein